MSEAPQKVLDRIAKMLRLAHDSGASEHERDTALRMVHNILAKYNLSLADIDTTERNRIEGRILAEKIFYCRPWARHVCQSAADLMFCSYVYTSLRGTKDGINHFIGRESNARSAGLMAEWLVESIHKEAKRAQRQAGMGNDYFRSFAWGAAQRIRERVRELKTRSTDSMALVPIYDQEKRENERFMREAFGSSLRTTTQKRIGIGSRDGYERGRIYGDSVALSNQLEDK